MITIIVVGKIKERKIRSFKNQFIVENSLSHSNEASLESGNQK